MIKNRLRVVLAEHGTNLTQLSRDLKRHRTTLQRFTREDRKTINAVVLNEICEFLNVQPGDIFIYEPDDTAAEVKG